MYNKNDLLSLSRIYCKANLNLKKIPRAIDYSDQMKFYIYTFFFNFMHKQFWRGLRAGVKDIVKESRHNAKL